MSLIPERVLLNGWNALLGKAENLRSSSNALKIINTNHERVIAGQSFHHATVSSLAGSNAETHILIVADSSSPHMVNYDFDTDQGQMELMFYENPFTDSNSLGTQETLHNINRKFKNTNARFKLYDNPFIDINSLGTLLDKDIIAQTSGGSVKSIDGNAGDSTGEWILNIGDTYLIRVINKSLNTAFYKSSITLYESEG